MAVLPTKRPWLARAISVSISLALFTSIGESLRHRKVGGDPEMVHQLFTTFKWAAISCLVIVGPVTGQVAKVSMEHLVGTLSGGILGFLVCWLAMLLAPEEKALWFGATTATIGWAGVWLGHVTGRANSFKLGQITFLLVFAASGEVHLAALIALSRMTGITLGVVLTLLLATIVMPTSAHAVVEGGVKDALHALLSLSALCWLPLKETAVFGLSADDREAGGTGAARMLALEDTLSFLAVKEIAADGQTRDAEATIIELYQALQNAEAALAPADNEAYVGRVFGSRFYVPRFLAPLCVCGRARKARAQARVPRDEVLATASAARTVGRVQISLYNLLQDGLDETVTDVLRRHFPRGLMPQLLESSTQSIMDSLDAIALGAPVNTAAQREFAAAVDELLRISGQERRRVQKRYDHYRQQVQVLRARAALDRDASSASHPRAWRAMRHVVTAMRQASGAWDRPRRQRSSPSRDGAAEPLLSAASGGCAAPPGHQSAAGAAEAIHPGGGPADASRLFSSSDAGGLESPRASGGLGSSYASAIASSPRVATSMHSCPSASTASPSAGGAASPLRHSVRGDVGGAGVRCDSARQDPDAATGAADRVAGFAGKAAGSLGADLTAAAGSADAQRGHGGSSGVLHGPSTGPAPVPVPGQVLALGSGGEEERGTVASAAGVRTDTGVPTGPQLGSSGEARSQPARSGSAHINIRELVEVANAAARMQARSPAGASTGPSDLKAATGGAGEAGGSSSSSDWTAAILAEPGGRNAPSPSPSHGLAATPGSGSTSIHSPAPLEGIVAAVAATRRDREAAPPAESGESSGADELGALLRSCSLGAEPAPLGESRAIAIGGQPRSGTAAGAPVKELSQGQAESAFDTAAPPQLGRDGGDGTDRLLLFPDTPAGHYAEITYFAFQFHMEELVEAVADLQEATTALVSKLASLDAPTTAHVDSNLHCEAVEFIEQSAAPAMT